MEEHGRLDIIALYRNFYYYTSDGQFQINVKTFIQYGLMLCACIIILSVDRMFIENVFIFKYPYSIGLIPTTIIFFAIILTLRRLKSDN